MWSSRAVRCQKFLSVLSRTWLLLSAAEIQGQQSIAVSNLSPPPPKAHACLHLKWCFSYDALKCVVKVYNLLKSFPLMSYFKIFLNISMFPMMMLKRFWVLPAGAALAGSLRWAPLLCSALPVAPCIALEMTLRLIDSTARPCIFFFFSLLTVVE